MFSNTYLYKPNKYKEIYVLNAFKCLNVVPNCFCHLSNFKIYLVF